jgi:hypothetical protein
VKIEDLDEPTPGISSPEDRGRLLAEAIAESETREAHYRQSESPRTGHWKGSLALSLLVIAGYIVLAPPQWLAMRPLPEVSSEERGRGVAVAIQLQARQIEVFRARHGRLPATLEEVPGRVSGVRFVRSNNRVYQLVAARPNGRALVYDSARPGPEFENIQNGWDSEPGS